MFEGMDPADQALECLCALAEEERSGWSSEALAQRVRDLAAMAERVEAELLRAVGQWDAQHAWSIDGALTAPSWLASRTTMTRAAGMRLTRAARLAFRHERTGGALARGDVSATAVQTIATSVTAHEQQYADHEGVLLEVASTLAADDLTTAMRAWRTAADDVADRRDPFAAFERRHLHLTDTFGGAKVDGFVDPESAQWIRAALARVDHPDPVEGSLPPRTAAQRAADNLVELARAALARDGGQADDESSPGRTRASGVPVVVDLDVVLDLHRIRGVSDDVAGVSDLLGSFLHGSHRVGGRPVSSSTVERLACDGELTRIVFAGRSQVVDVGRRTRVLQPTQRRALRRRDEHCRFPGCDRPAHWSDAHHLVHWLHGGPTDLDNLVLLCRRHHVLCHEGGWTLSRAADGAVTATPPGAPRPPPEPRASGPSRDRRRRSRRRSGVVLAA